MLCLLTLVYTTVLQFSLPSVILCFGSDGHIAFEQAQDNCRIDNSGVQETHLADNHSNLVHQDADCYDITLSGLFSLPLVEKAGKSKNTMLSATITNCISLNVCSVSLSEINNDLAITLASRKGLQTTILII